MTVQQELAILLVWIKLVLAVILPVPMFLVLVYFSVKYGTLGYLRARESFERFKSKKGKNP